MALEAPWNRKQPAQGSESARGIARSKVATLVGAGNGQADSRRSAIFERASAHRHAGSSSADNVWAWFRAARSNHTMDDAGLRGAVMMQMGLEIEGRVRELGFRGGGADTNFIGPRATMRPPKPDSTPCRAPVAFSFCSRAIQSPGETS